MAWLCKLAAVKFDFKALRWLYSRLVLDVNKHYCSDVVQHFNFCSFVLSRNVSTVKSASCLFLMRMLNTEHVQHHQYQK